MSNKPYVSIVIATYNEGPYIERCLDSLVDDFVIENAEFLIADGGSRDKTRQIIEEYRKKHPQLSLTLIDNPKRHQSYGLNEAIGQSKGDVIVWIGAHAFYPKHYVERCVRLLEDTGADNVGGAIYPRGKTRFQKLAAYAMQHPAGVGNSRFRLGNYRGYVDTVFPGTFKKETFERLGGFDPYTNQDAEFNLRILKSGGRIYMDSSIKIEYFPRDTLRGLIRQYFNYGKGRCRTTLKHKRFTSFRQMAPIFLVLGLVGSLFLNVSVGPLFLMIPLSYIGAIFAASIAALRGRRNMLRDVPALAIIFMVMHISWGIGFWAKLLRVVK